MSTQICEESVGIASLEEIVNDLRDKGVTEPNLQPSELPVVSSRLTL